MQGPPSLVQGVVRASHWTPTRLGRVRGQLLGEDGPRVAPEWPPASPCPCVLPGSEARGSGCDQGSCMGVHGPREPRAGVQPSRICEKISWFRLFLVTLLKICSESSICRFMTCTISGKFSTVISSFAACPPSLPSGTQALLYLLILCCVPHLLHTFDLLASLSCPTSGFSIPVSQPVHPVPVVDEVPLH